MTSAGVRSSPIAGTWYPGDREALGEVLDQLLAASSVPPVQGKLVALVSPHAGYRYSGACAAAGYTLVRDGGWKRVIILGPSHHVGFTGAALPEHDAWETPLGRVQVDRPTCDALENRGVARRISGADRREHSIEIQVPFLQRVLGDFIMVPLMVGELDEHGAETLAAALRDIAGGDTLFVASSDLTHYGAAFDYMPFDREVRVNLRELDQGAIRLMRARDWSGLRAYRAQTGITACGLRPIEILLRMLPENTEGELLRYYTSGDLTGDWEHVVSYASIGFFATEAPVLLSRVEREALLSSARSAIRHLHHGVSDESVVGDGYIPDTSPLRQRRGVFVTLTREGGIRGCIGSVMPDRPLYLAVREQARACASQDPRFEAVRPEEMDDVVIEISVLSPLRVVSSAEDYDPEQHGILLEKEGHRALFLPQVARERRWDRETTLRRLAAKAGLPAGTWREGSVLSIFTAEVFSEEEPGA